MPRQHITLSEQMMRELDAICARGSMVKSKFVQRGIQMAIDDANKRFGEAANDAAAAQATVGKPVHRPALAAVPVAPPSQDGVTCFRRGNVTWFSLDETCKVLGVARDRLLAEIDAEDDVLDYQGKRWIDSKGISEARALCADSALSESFGNFVQTKTDAPG